MRLTTRVYGIGELVNWLKMVDIRETVTASKHNIYKAGIVLLKFGGLTKICQTIP